MSQFVSIIKIVEKSTKTRKDVFELTCNSTNCRLDVLVPEPEGFRQSTTLTGKPNPVKPRCSGFTRRLIHQLCKHKGNSVYVVFWYLLRNFSKPSESSAWSKNTKQSMRAMLGNRRTHPSLGLSHPTQRNHSTAI